MFIKNPNIENGYQWCAGCSTTKPLELFSKNQRYCKVCKKVKRAANKHVQQAYNEKNREKLREYNKKRWVENKETLRLKNKLWIQAHKEERKSYYEQYKLDNADRQKEYRKQQYRANPEKYKQIYNEYRILNKEKVNKRQREYNQERRKDPSYRAMKNLRNRMQRAIVLQHGRKHTSLTTIVGCSILAARNHIASLFQPGMTWDNYGEWEIDHIKPCDSFDLTLLEQQKLCFHWTNLQPLWWQDNVRKGNKLDWVNPKEREVGALGIEPRITGL
jgi:hypothetical protein